jgi:uncharacterized protein
MLLKLLIIGGVLYALYRFAGGTLLPRKGKGKEKSPTKGETPKEDEETLVECAHCSTYVVKREAIHYRGRYYCSRECLPAK